MRKLYGRQHDLVDRYVIYVSQMTTDGSLSKYGFLFRSEFFFRTSRELEYLFFL